MWEPCSSLPWTGFVDAGRAQVNGVLSATPPTRGLQVRGHTLGYDHKALHMRIVQGVALCGARYVVGLTPLDRSWHPFLYSYSSCLPRHDHLQYSLIEYQLGLCNIT